MTKTKKNPSLSLIIPAYNETVRLTRGLSRVTAFLSGKRYAWEIIIVDDGSKIPVKKLLHMAYSHLPVKIFRLNKNYGKGKAIAYGVSRATGKNIVFSDADLSVPIVVVDAIMEQLKHHPVVITSRRSRASEIVVHQPVAREAAGRLFTMLSNTICSTEVTDVTCGCKGFTRDTAKRLFGTSRIYRWVFDTEILYLARKYGYSIAEIPVHWSNKEGSKVRLKDSIGSLYDLLRIRWYDMRGEYDT